jgi:VanZ family protein
VRARDLWSAYLPALAWTGFCTWLLLLPGKELGGAAETTERFEALGHALLIFVLAWLAARSARKMGGDRPRSGWWGVAAAIVYAVLLEVAQQWIPGRGFEWMDIAASVVGALASAEVPGGVDPVRPAARRR